MGNYWYQQPSQIELNEVSEDTLDDLYKIGDKYLPGSTFAAKHDWLGSSLAYQMTDSAKEKWDLKLLEYFKGGYICKITVLNCGSKLQGHYTSLSVYKVDVNKEMTTPEVISKIVKKGFERFLIKINIEHYDSLCVVLKDKYNINVLSAEKTNEVDIYWLSVDGNYDLSKSIKEVIINNKLTNADKVEKITNILS